MSLYERGKFQLSDPVARYIPAWTGLKVREKSRPTAPSRSSTRTGR